ncbi:unnamed protein product [Adineta steineri]|uniref:Uncharacterized protein n=1 Tax=Adineta steineri TaxID=433720 RepID=A0A820NZN5_9BILA|nr:unnamed protein product [Adineta steineri]
MENSDGFEIYSIDLRNTSTLSKLTNNEAIEFELQLSIDSQHVLFRTLSLNSNKGKWNNTQFRLHSLNLINGQITRLGENFRGSINGHAFKHDSSIYILGQLGTEVQIYTHHLPIKDLIRHNGWNGTYESITVIQIQLLHYLSI